MKRLQSASVTCLVLAALATGAASGRAEEAVTFRNKAVTMTVGFAAGGGTDVVARLIGQYLSRYLPGTPTLVVQNMPGAEGVAALNALVKMAKPDGLTLTIGVTTQVDPLVYPGAHAVYDPLSFEYIGGTGRPGSVMIISNDAYPRLNDKTRPPVTMGALAALRSSMQMTMWGTEYRHWNLKWVFGYPGTNELKLALERDEIDTTALSAIPDVAEVMSTGRFRILLQSGSMQRGTLQPRPEFGDAPLFTDLVGHGVTDPLGRQGMNYTLGMTQIGQWLALPPATPAPIAAAYRAAFHAVFADHEFHGRMLAIVPDVTEMSADDTRSLIANIVRTPPEVIAHMRDVGRRQGIAMGQ